jgi:two-component system chemotaxis response regulator CheB
MNTSASVGPRNVLIVDDSALVRQALRAVIESDPAFRVHAAVDPFDAVAIMSKVAPEVIVLDIDMPRMDGLTFLRKLMRQHPLPVIMCTTHVELGLEALNLGALEVLPKPNWEVPAQLQEWSSRVLESLHQALGSTMPKRASATHRTIVAEPKQSVDAILPPAPFRATGVSRERLIVVGASTGGVQAVSHLLASLPASSPGVVVVQHMPGGFTKAFADRLDRDPKVRLRVVEAGPEEMVGPGKVIIVPGSVHGVVRRVGAGYRVELVDGPLVNRHKPSVDVLFRSAAQAAGSHAGAVILTGMGDDGAVGLRELRAAGAHTIAQDEATCVVFGMPREAIRMGAAVATLPLDQIGPALTRWAGAPMP